MDSKFSKSRARSVAVAVAVGASFVSMAAHAEVDASVTTAFADVLADGKSVAAIVTPVVVAVMGLGIVQKLIKRFGNKI